MNTSEFDEGPRAVHIEVTDEELTAKLADGRRVSVPLTWFPRLLRATAAQRASWELVAGGVGVRWPEVDEDLSVAGLLRGNAAPDSAGRAS